MPAWGHFSYLVVREILLKSRVICGWRGSAIRNDPLEGAVGVMESGSFAIGQGSDAPVTAPAVWYLVHCKPRQDERAEEHLLRQGYVCYGPRIRTERLVRGRVQVVEEPLFPGYLFIRLRRDDDWSKLRSTRGVRCLVSFGGYPLGVPVSLIESLKSRSGTTQPLLQPGDKVRIIEGSFADLEAIFQRMDGEERAVLLMSMLSREQQCSLPIASMRRA